MKRRHRSRFSTLSTCVQCGIISLLIWVLFACFWMLSVGGRGGRDADTLTDLHTCPACYSRTICNHLRFSDAKPLRSNVSAEYTSWWSLLFSTSSDSYNVKNVFEVEWRGRLVVLKKLSHDKELAWFDLRAGIDCTRCSQSQRLLNYRNLLAARFGPLPPNVGQSPAPKSWPLSSRLLSSPPNLLEHFTCSSQRILDLLYGSHVDSEPANKLYHVATMLLINPEPLIIQAFPQTQGWPFPRYLGACGRIVAEQYLGKSLLEFYNSDWSTRLKLSLQLLELCEVLTVGRDGFSLYLTDFSADNLVVDSDGRLYVVDVENAVIVDHHQVHHDHTSTANVTHVSPVLCDSCMGYEPEQLCKHVRSDHNYMAVCRGLLYSRAFSHFMPGGLLHDTPEWLLDIYPQFIPALELCADPTLAKTSSTTSTSSLFSDVIDQIANQRAVVGGASGSDQTELSRIEVAQYLRTVMNRMLSELQ